MTAYVEDRHGASLAASRRGTHGYTDHQADRADPRGGAEGHLRDAHGLEPPRRALGSTDDGEQARGWDIQGRSRSRGQAPEADEGQEDRADLAREQLAEGHVFEGDVRAREGR